MLPPDLQVTSTVQAVDLQQLGFDDALIEQICSFLNSGATDLGDSKPPGVASGSFGSAPASLTCAAKAGEAHQVVIGAIDDMVAGLHGYRDGLHTWANKTRDVDVDAGSDFDTLTAQAQACTATSRLASPSQCRLPGAGGHR